jgi:hypothetical protein
LLGHGSNEVKRQRGETEGENGRTRERRVLRLGLPLLHVALGLGEVAHR